MSLAAALVVSACSETGMQDLLGTGKSAAPDASQVTVGQNLALPPDLQLRAPADGPVNDYQATAVQAAAPPLQAPPPAAQAQPVPQPADQIRTAAVSPPEQDVWQRYGISKTYPDGKPKPERILYEELRQAQLAEKRRANPSYGTIWNMGELWSD